LSEFLKTQLMLILHLFPREINRVVKLVKEVSNTPLHVCWLEQTFLNLTASLDISELEIALIVPQVVSTWHSLVREG